MKKRINRNIKLNMIGFILHEAEPKANGKLGSCSASIRCFMSTVYIRCFYEFF